MGVAQLVQDIQPASAAAALEFVGAVGQGVQFVEDKTGGDQLAFRNTLA